MKEKSDFQKALEIILEEAFGDLFVTKLVIALDVMKVTPYYDHEAILKAIFGYEEDEEVKDDAEEVLLAETEG